MTQSTTARVPMVHTPKDMDELMDYLDSYSGPERALAYIIASMTWNLAMKQVDEGLIKAEEIQQEINND